MNPKETKPQEEKKTLYQSVRESFLPVKPTDSKFLKYGKEAGFYLFGLLFVIVSLLLIVAATLVL